MANPRPPKRQKHSSLPDEINNFILLPITLPSPLPSVPSATHILYLRRHEEPPKPPSTVPTESPNTLFVVNIPLDSTKELLRGLFASLGARLQDIQFQGEHENDNENLRLPDIWDRRLHPSGSSAHITFPDSGDIAKIFKTIAKERHSHDGGIREWGVGVNNPTSTLGLQRYLTHQKLQYPNPNELQSLLDNALTRFNAAEQARMISLKRLRSEPDEEGFITVTRREREDVVVERKNKAIGLEDFYKFQKRERREKQMEELRKKFEEDKKKVEKAKEGRKFKPF